MQHIKLRYSHMYTVCIKQFAILTLNSMLLYSTYDQHVIMYELYIMYDTVYTVYEVHVPTIERYKQSRMIDNLDKSRYKLHKSIYLYFPLVLN